MVWQKVPLKEAALISAEKTIDSRSFPSKEIVFVVFSSKLSELSDPLEARVYDSVGNISSEVFSPHPLLNPNSSN